MGTHHTDALLRLVRRWFDERTVTGVFEPLLADHQREWLDAAPAARLRIAIRTAATFITALLWVTPRALFLTPTPPSMMRRIVARMIVFVSVVSGLLMIPFLTQFGEVPPGRLTVLLLWLLPSMIVFAFPFAMGFVVDGVRRRSEPTRLERMAVVRVAVCAVLFTFVLGGWIVPATNQQFRLTARAEDPRPPARGVRELTTVQLIEVPWLARGEGPGRAEAVRRELHNRASLALLPALLIWLRWRALDRPSPQWLLPAWLAATVTFGTFAVWRFNEVTLENALGLAPGYAAWLPLLFFIALGHVRHVVVRRTTVTT